MLLALHEERGGVYGEAYRRRHGLPAPASVQRAVTALSRDDVIERSCALAAGVACFLAKPFSAEELWAVVGGTADKAA